MMIDKKLWGVRKGRRSAVLVGAALNVLLVLVVGSVIIDLMPKGNEGGGGVQGATVSRVSTSAAGMNLDTPEKAVSSANGQLGGMDTGNIFTIDTEDPDFSANYYRDFGRGDVSYWELEDSNTTVFIMADDDEEIIYYERSGWVSGSSSENEILAQAATIAGQFADLPADRTSAEADFYPYMLNFAGLNEDTGLFETDNHAYWEVVYNRSKDGIVAEDHIQMLLLPNGYCSLYSKTWDMSLASLSTSYIVSQAEAEEAAEDFAGEGAVAHMAYKMIVRPNYMWTHYDVEYGNSPMCVWVVWVEDEGGNLCIVHVNGNTGVNVGGDFSEGYYS